MRTHTHTSCLTLTLALLAASLATAQAQTICGATLSGVTVTLSADVVCPAFSTITLDGAVLDLGGFTVTFTVAESAIVLTGMGATLRNGALTGAGHGILFLRGQGGHTVANVILPRLADSVVHVESDGNTLTAVTAASLFSAAFRITGNTNLFSGSQGTCPFVGLDGCIVIVGNNNTVASTSIHTAAGPGGTNVTPALKVLGSGNLITGNTATSAVGPGIRVDGTGNTITGNTAEGTPAALLDASGTCDVNTWSGNIASSGTPLCTLQAPAPPPADPPPSDPPSDPAPPSLVALNNRDLDRDGIDDLYWHHPTTGDLAVWYMQAGALRTGAALAHVPDTQWHFVGTGDLDGDGHPDAVWRHSSGQVAAWFMQDGRYRHGVTYQADASWELRALADLDGDGYADLVWRHLPSGALAAWLMQGATVRQGVVLAQTSDPAWDLVSAADIDGDGMPDLVWQHTSGDVAVWTMAGTRPVRGLMLATGSGPSWHLCAVGDVDGDGHPDLVWQHTGTGEVATWLLNGGHLRGSTHVGMVSGGWELH